REAVGRAKTWHFVGWRLVKGERVRWEVWGQRSPFLYRETVGDEVLLDDGTRRVHLLPPENGGKQRGECLITPSRFLDNFVPSGEANGVRTGFLAGIGGADVVSYLTPVSGDARHLEHQSVKDWGETPRRERAILTVDAETLLPTRYTVTQETYPLMKGAAAFIPRGMKPLSVTRTADLIPRYDVPLPANISQLVPPATYHVTDATKTLSGVTRDGSVCTREGVTLRATVLGRDAQGNVRMGIQAWIGDAPLKFRRQGLSLRVRLADLAIAAREKAGVDSNGTVYVELGLPPVTASNAEQPEIWITPTEPIEDTAPATVRLLVKAELTRTERVSKMPVIEDTFVFELLLPRADTPLPWTLPAEDDPHFAGPPSTLSVTTAARRGLFYMHYAFQPSFPTQHTPRAYLERATHWYGALEKEATASDNRVMRDIARNNIASISRMKEEQKQSLDAGR
ncbi:MAG: hypothetical protein H8F28_10300, partial [Fibrella sp.]|nr:hypothetical protein [Armatimonadota bacterium]